MLEEGRGCEHDDVEAFRWHLAASEQGNALSQYCAACCLLEGRGAPKDEAEARRWLRLSADAGFGPAARKLQGRDDDEEEDKEEGGGGEEPTPLLGLAERVARQLQELRDDDDAEVVLEELLAEVPGLLELMGDGSDDEEAGIQAARP